MSDNERNVARRTALIFAGIILAFLGATLAWLYPEMKRKLKKAGDEFNVHRGNHPEGAKAFGFKKRISILLSSSYISCMEMRV